MEHGCDKLRRFDLDGIDASKISFPCNCIMDTLKGEWSWYNVFSGWTGDRVTYFNLL
jgi:hypothetical protein